MKSRRSHSNHTRRVGLPAFVLAGIERTERERKAAVIARPMRAMFDLLASGEVLELDGHAVMRMPECDHRYTDRTEYCAIAPAMLGWVDLWARIAPDLPTYYIATLAERLQAEKPITQLLVEQAREEFEAHIRRIPSLPPGHIQSAITTTQIAWELEKQEHAA